LQPIDPIIQQHRDGIADLDRQILALLEERIRRVRDLKGLKAQRDMPFHDPGQEARVLDTLRTQRSGDLSEEGLEALFTQIIHWSKREAARD